MLTLVTRWFINRDLWATVQPVGIAGDSRGLGVATDFSCQFGAVSICHLEEGERGVVSRGGVGGRLIRHKNVSFYNQHSIVCICTVLIFNKPAQSETVLQTTL